MKKLSKSHSKCVVTVLSNYSICFHETGREYQLKEAVITSMFHEIRVAEQCDDKI